MRLYYYLVLFLFISCSMPEDDLKINSPSGESQELLDIRKVVYKVYNWQKNNPSIHSGSRTWHRSTFYIGIMSVFHSLENPIYLEQAYRWAENNNWEIGDRPRNANDQACGQIYLELYNLDPNEYMIMGVIDSINFMIRNPKPGREDWYWADALFMAPPVIAKLGTITMDKTYHRFLNEMWWDVVDYLYDPEESLFYRDERYIGKVNENGKKIFWSRGNGWVIGGLVRILQVLPEKDPYYSDYVTLYRNMVSTLTENQGDDGLWRPNIIDMEDEPYPETSGSGFFCYAIAWGINNNILDRSIYEPFVEKAWKGLNWAVNEDGRLGWVQSANAEPDIVSEEDWEEYGSGAFLLAASEVFKLHKSKFQ